MVILMVKELKNFIIESDVNLDYFDEVVNHIINNEKRILDFFKIKKLSNKIKIMILSYNTFSEFIKNKYGEVLSYVSGDSDSLDRRERREGAGRQPGLLLCSGHFP